MKLKELKKAIKANKVLKNLQIGISKDGRLAAIIYDGETPISSTYLTDDAEETEDVLIEWLKNIKEIRDNER